MIHVVWDQALGGLEWLIIGGQRVLSTWLLELPHGMAARFPEKTLRERKIINCWDFLRLRPETRMVSLLPQSMA